MNTFTQPRICFIGGGNLAQAIIRGLLSADFAASNITATARSEQTCAKLNALGGINVLRDNIKAIYDAEIILLSVKPKDLALVLQQLRGHLNTKQILISLAAAVPAAQILAWLHERYHVLRAMPNTPVAVRQGVYGLYAPAETPDHVKQQVTELLDITGQTIWLHSEPALDSLSCISGCGPAYGFLLIAALEQAAIKLGFDAAQAKILAAQTIAGAGALAAASSESAQQLCQNVCSPGGMTEQGVQYLQANNFSNLIQTAVQKTHEHLQKILVK